MLNNWALFPYLPQETQQNISISSRESWVEHLNKLFGPAVNWFIAGSFANLEVKRPNDIDIYFTTHEDFINAQSILTTVDNAHHLGGSVFADTYVITPIELAVQLITKHYGTPEEIFKTMDINVCKKAFLPNQMPITAPESFDSLRIDNLASATFKRYLKYYKRFHPKRNLDKPFCYLFEQYLDNTTLLINYYNHEEKEPANKILYKLFQTCINDPEPQVSSRVQREILERIHAHTPELLL